VITILTLVTAATVPLMAPVTGQRKVREAARLVASMLAQAQSRALATGRPVGVCFDRLSSNEADNRANQSIDISLCEVPPPYAGETRGATARVNGNTVSIQSGIPQGMCFAGDHIRFNYRGRIYRINGAAPGATGAMHPDNSLTGAGIQIDRPGPNVQGVPFQIFRQPLKTADEPVTLPVGAVVDLAFSGLGNGTECGIPIQGSQDVFINSLSGTTVVGGIPKPVLVMFGPSGNLDSIYYAYRPKASGSRTIFEQVKTITPMYLLIGRPRDDSGTLPPNVMNQENVWIAVNPQSGLVTTSEVAIGPNYWQEKGITSQQLSDYQQAVVDSRKFARSAQNMGGR
jgi:hypothetical protein